MVVLRSLKTALGRAKEKHCRPREGDDAKADDGGDDANSNSLHECFDVLSTHAAPFAVSSTAS